MPEQLTVPRLPFTAEIWLTDTFGSCAVSLEVRGTNPGEPLEGARRALADFAAGADLGMFCGVGWSPQMSVGDWLPAPPTGPGRIHGRLSLSGVDVGAWRILFHLLCRVHESGPPLAAVSVTAEGAAGRPLNVSSLLARPLPGRTGNLPFRLM